MCHASGALIKAPQEALDTAACSLELIHAYSLVHDDLPCMDNDTLRRGKPTVHIAYDEATALLVGDALQAQAFMLLSQRDISSNLSDTQRVAMMYELAKASGAQGMVAGQSIDLQSVGLALNQTQLEAMHLLKTGALLRAAIHMGWQCGTHNHDPKKQKALDDYAQAIGLAFQIADDILDATADLAVLGKTPGKDAQDQKPTYVSLLGLQAAQQLAKQLQEKAHKALNIFGETAEYLHHLADWIVQRHY